MRDVLFPSRPRKGDPEGYFTVQDNLDILARYFRLGEATEDEFPLTWDNDTQSFRPANAVVATGDITAWSGQAGQTRIGKIGPSAQAGIAFGNPLDTILYRFGADRIRTDGTLEAEQGFWLPNAPNADAILAGTWFAGDTQDRFEIYADGKHWWGPGGVTAPDTNLYRAFANVLKTDDQFIAVTGFGVGNASSTAFALTTWTDGGADDMFQQLVNGKHSWGDGTNPVDTNLYRSAANTLKTDDDFLAAEIGAATGTSAETWIGPEGPSGQAGIIFGSSYDTNLYRSAADELKTDDDLVVAGDLTVSGTITGGGLGTTTLTALYTFTGENHGSLTAITMAAESWDDISINFTSQAYCTVTAGKYEVSVYGLLSGQSGTGGGNIAIERHNSSGVFQETLSQGNLGLNGYETCTGMGNFAASDRIVVLTQNGATGTAGTMAGRVSIKKFT